VKKVCTAYASNLRKLSLVANSHNLLVLFSPNPSDFTSLEEVSFTYSSRDGNFADVEIPSKFFLAIASTLATLNISFSYTFQDLSGLLRHFICQGGEPAFPKLTRLSLYDSGRPEPHMHSHCLVKFLEQQADTLKHLHLQHSTPSLYASQSLVLPHLETLGILKVDSPWDREELTSSEGFHAIRAYIQHSGSTLTSLSLTHCSFTLHDLGILLDLLEQGTLKSLTVDIQILSPQVLDVLAGKLPQLEKLTVGFAHLRSNDGADVPTWTGQSSLEDLKNEVQPQSP
jgi:hypothetical protein